MDDASDAEEDARSFLALLPKVVIVFLIADLIPLRTEILLEEALEPAPESLLRLLPEEDPTAFLVGASSSLLSFSYEILLLGILGTTGLFIVISGLKVLNSCKSPSDSESKGIVSSVGELLLFFILVCKKLLLGVVGLFANFLGLKVFDSSKPLSYSESNGIVSSDILDVDCLVFFFIKITFCEGSGSLLRN